MYFGTTHEHQIIYKEGMIIPDECKSGLIECYESIPVLEQSMQSIHKKLQRIETEKDIDVIKDQIITNM